MVVDIGSQMVQLIEVVDDAAVLRERHDVILDYLLRLLQRHVAIFVRLAENILGDADHAFVILDEGIAAVEDG